jgi:hypothetical protein
MLLGISLGNWNASLAIAASDDHSPELIANAEGDRFIPTAFHWGHDQVAATVFWDFLYFFFLISTYPAQTRGCKENSVGLFSAAFVLPSKFDQ